MQRVSADFSCFKSIDDCIADIDEVVGLRILCKYKIMLNFMANYFNEKGIPSVAYKF